MVHSAQRLAMAVLGRTQVAFLLQTMEQWIQASRTDSVAVPAQLFDHSQPEDRFLDGMMEHMKADQSRIQIAVCREAI